MKEDIKEVLEQFKYGNYSIEQATNELFDLYNVSKSFTVDEIVSELEDSDHLDDAIMFFKESK